MQLGVIVNNKYAPLKHFVYVLTFPTLLCLLLLLPPLLLSWTQRPHVRDSVRAYGSLFLSGAVFCFPITCRHKSAHPAMTNLQNSALRRCVFKAGTYFVSHAARRRLRRPCSRACVRRRWPQQWFEHDEKRWNLLWKAKSVHGSWCFIIGREMLCLELEREKLTPPRKENDSW